MVGAGVGNDAIPDDGRVGVVLLAGPVGSDVYKHLLGVPCEEARKVGFEGESQNRVFLLLGGVVMRAALDTK